MQDRFFSIARNLLTLVGGFFLGRSFLNQPITSDFLDLAIGGLLTIAGIVWSIVDKSATIEKLQGAARHIASTIGGILVTAGMIKPEQVELYLGVVLALIPILQGSMSRAKVAQIKTGEVSIHQLKGGSTDVDHVMKNR